MPGSPTSLQSKALAQFDRLVKAKELVWAEVPARYVTSTPFNVSQRSIAFVDEQSADLLRLVRVSSSSKLGKETDDCASKESRQCIRRH